MKYRVVAEIILDLEADARRAYGMLQAFKASMRTIRKGEPAEERSRIMLERHYHDDDPTRPCEVLEEVLSE